MGGSLYSGISGIVSPEFADITNTLLNGYEEKDVRSLKYGIGGGGMGINAMIIANMKKEYVIVVLSNYDPPTASNIAYKLSKMM